MKTIRKLNAPTPGLAEYLNAVGDNANWNEFRSHNAGAAYRELRDALIQNQHGLCASFIFPNLCYFGPLGERVLARQPQPWI